MINDSTPAEGSNVILSDSSPIKSSDNKIYISSHPNNSVFSHLYP